jgi:polysaccharide export outer membrane protein
VLWLLPGLAAAGEGAPRIAPGDVLDVQVWREPDLSGEHRVAADGTIQHVLAGRVPAAGGGLTELGERLRGILERDYLRQARVSVTLLQPVRREAAVLGAVAHPGSHAVQVGTRVLDLLVAAGGLAAEASGSATLVRGTDAAAGEGERLAVDVLALLSGRDAAQNLPVAPGDVLMVDARVGAVSSGPVPLAGRVRVVGEVQKPGSYSLAEAPTVLDAVLAAGGCTEYAAHGRTRIVRGTEESGELRVPLDAVLEGREPDVALRDGDILVVPESFF